MQMRILYDLDKCHLSVTNTIVVLTVLELMFRGHG